MNYYESFIHKSRYARYRDDLGRRENWDETVSRYMEYISRQAKEYGYELTTREYNELEQAILQREVMPSMRALMTAGPALERDNVAAFNCSYLPIDHPRAFDELMYILMCGTGVGFSVESRYISQLPIIAEEMYDSDTTIVVADSKIGWASGYRELISLLYSGKVPRWDLSRIRPAGSRLKTFGGRASGPEPLHDLLEFTVATFRNAAGRRLNTLEVHDLVCKIADIVVVGGVRRSALISLSDLNDDRMRDAKSGAWWEHDVQRALANNSAVYEERPDVGTFIKEWAALYSSKSGERGFFNRNASVRQAEKNGRRDTGYEFGTNPCSEIILRPHGFCNLTEVVIRPKDTLDDLRRKVKLATILGTLQSTMTNYRYLRKVWQSNAEEERLLGVSLTGIMDNPLMRSELELRLSVLREEAIAVNKMWAKRLGINQSAAITCVKPSGTVSQLAGCSSGIHPAYAPYYVRTVRADVKDPLARFLQNKGVPFEPDVTKPNAVLVFSFPARAPEGAVTRNDLSAVEQLEIYLAYQEHWCEHKPSITVYVRESEWLDVGAWVYKHFDKLGGVSFLPHSEHNYRQAPYQEISRAEYLERLENMPELDWEELGLYEMTDMTTGSQELACVAGVCEIPDMALNGNGNGRVHEEHLTKTV